VGAVGSRKKLETSLLPLKRHIAYRLQQLVATAQAVTTVRVVAHLCVSTDL